MSVVGVCGLGLIGSSIARAALLRGRVLGYDPDQRTREDAAAIGIDVRGGLTELLESDVLVLAGPTAVNAALLSELPPGTAAVMDVGSAKLPIVEAWASNRAVRFIPSHPMAGSEFAGFSAGRADLFQGASWPVVVVEHTDPQALALVLSLIAGMGARAVPVSAAAHDRAVATVSHLPHLLAGALGQTMSNHESLALRLAAGSFRDVTRISGSPPARTAEFVVANHEQAAARARAAASALNAVADSLDAAAVDDVADWLEASHRARGLFESSRSGEVEQLIIPSAEALRDRLLAARDTGLEVLSIDGGSAGFQVALLGAPPW